MKNILLIIIFNFIMNIVHASQSVYYNYIDSDGIFHQYITQQKDKHLLYYTNYINITKNRLVFQRYSNIVIRGEKKYPHVIIDIGELTKEQQQYLDDSNINRSLLLLNQNSIYGRKDIAGISIRIENKEGVIHLQEPIVNYFFIKDYLIVVLSKEIIKITKNKIYKISLDEELLHAANGPILYCPNINIHTTHKYTSPYINRNQSYNMLFRYYYDDKCLYLQSDKGKIYCLEYKKFDLKQIYSANNDERDIKKGILFNGTLYNEETNEVIFIERGILKNKHIISEKPLFLVFNKNIMSMVYEDSIQLMNSNNENDEILLDSDVTEILQKKQFKYPFYFNKYHTIFIFQKKDNENIKSIYYIIENKSMKNKQMNLCSDNIQEKIEIIGSDRKGFYFIKYKENISQNELHYYDFYRGHSKYICSINDTMNAEYRIIKDKLHRIIVENESIKEIQRFHKDKFVLIYKNDEL